MMRAIVATMLLFALVGVAVSLQMPESGTDNQSRSVHERSNAPRSSDTAPPTPTVTPNPYPAHSIPAPTTGPDATRAAMPLSELANAFVERFNNMPPHTPDSPIYPPVTLVKYAEIRPEDVVLFNGRLDKEIISAGSPTDLGVVLEGTKGGQPYYLLIVTDRDAPMDHFTWGSRDAPEA